MISPILALAFVAATTLAMPSPPTETKTSTTRELVASVYGPLSSWEPIRLIDAFPDALVDGKPVNSSVVLGYRAPALATAEQRNRAQELLFSREGGIQKRAEFGCYRAGHYILQYQLRSAVTRFCNDLTTKHASLDNGGTVFDRWDRYPDASGNWAGFTDAKGNPTTVLLGIKVNAGYVYNAQSCANALGGIVNSCHGGSPDSQGGYWWGANNGQNDARVDPDE